MKTLVILSENFKKSVIAIKKILIIIMAVLLAVKTANACTTFVIKDSVNLVFGRNYDFDLNSGFIVLNKRGLEKQAIVPPPYIPARWISKYGSITFNQTGIDAPMGGMNEKGLVIAQMALPESYYPEDKNKMVVNQLEWIQYQLDNASSLEELIEQCNRFRIVPVAIPVHYLVCDSSGKIGVIEFLNGKTTIYTGNDITVPVCSNINYKQSISALKDYKGYGGDKDIPETWQSIEDIIAIADSRINKFRILKGKDPVGYGFEILSAVGTPTRTQWSVIYDLKKRKIHFTTRKNKIIRTIAFNKMDFTCSNEIYIKELSNNNPLPDQSGQFMVITREYYSRYKKELLNWYKNHVTGFPEIPDEMIRLETEYVFNRRCVRDHQGRTITR
ncbi:MAG: linear amide C-N hydrolase [Bacteroidales bacterium]|nr:linear amide C-N hydrolase [Bacteroidales bacterium]